MVERSSGGLDRVLPRYPIRCDGSPLLGAAKVIFDRVPEDGKVLLTLTHRKLPTENE